MGSPVLVNLGCGTVWHNAWRNYDLDPLDAAIATIDLAKPLPLADRSVDAIYHAHVLEHLSPATARRLMAECFRVLKVGGIVRVVVPDLESIAHRYLDALNRGDDLEYDWAVLELLDQLVRARSEGAMGEFLRTTGWRDHPQIRDRVGTEISVPTQAASYPRRHRRPLRTLSRIRFALARFWLTEREKEMVREAQFRAAGEVHRWMYDRRSLARLLHATGFIEPLVQTATSSNIPDYASYLLDSTVTAQARHPDSLYMEAMKR